MVVEEEEEEEEETTAPPASSLLGELASDGYHAASTSLEVELAKVLKLTQPGSEIDGEHSYAKPYYREPPPQATERYTFLWAVVTDGSKKRIFNTLPRAVAVLSNSKRLFLSHVSVMLECLNPALAELCYIDTDSCVWSQTYKDLEQCVMPNKKATWQNAAIMADETGDLSCHGKLKLEGIFDGGLFKTLFIYRLFRRADDDDDDDDDDNGCGTVESWKTAYTRCKGIARWAADQIPSAQFNPLLLPSGEANRLAVHRNCLRPTRAGEIRLYHETRSLALPFNLKRWVTADGLHTLSFGLPGHCYPTEAIGDDDDDDDDEAAAAAL